MTMRPDPTFHATAKLAMQAPVENYAYTLMLSPDFSQPDGLAVVDVNPKSNDCGKIVLFLLDQFFLLVHIFTQPERQGHGADRGQITHTGRSIAEALGDSFRCDRLVDGFFFGDGRDLSGYVDGTENPEGDDAVEAALVNGAGAGLDGGSFVAAQQWVHDLSHLKAMPQSEQDDIIGRRLSDNEELDEAPASAHVKRTEQESFDPEAFVVRRSMPWAEGGSEGLVFVDLRLEKMLTAQAVASRLLKPTVAAHARL